LRTTRSKAVPVLLAFLSIILIALPVGQVHSAATEPADGVREYWAVIIGISDYESIRDLNYADDDAYDIRNALVNHGWEPSHITLLIDSAASKAGIQNAITTLDSNADSDDVVLFFFSGHGYAVPDVPPFDEDDHYDEVLCAWDTWFSDSFIFNVIVDDELGSWLDRLEAQAKVVILDSCFSGGFLKAGGETVKTMDLPRVFLRDGFSKDLYKPGYVVLTACDEEETSMETSALKNGVFTYYLVEGMGPGLPADTDSDYLVSAEEAFAYADPRATAYYPGQDGQIYDGVMGEVELTIRHVSLESTDSAGVTRDKFDVVEDVYAGGSGYAANATYPIYVVTDTTWTEGMPIPSRVPGTATTVTTDAGGAIAYSGLEGSGTPPALIWEHPLKLGEYDIVLDVNKNGLYDRFIDALDDRDVEVVTAGFLVIPEMPLGAISALSIGLLAFIPVAFYKSRKTRI